MKTILIGTLALVLAAGAQGNEAERRLKAAMNAELVNGDLKAAIRQYGEIAAKYKRDRAVAAKALVKMAEAYQKMGNAESRRIYERVVREYGDQREAARLARARIGGNTRPQNAGVVARQVWKGTRVDTGGTVSADGRYLTFTDWRENELGVRDLVTGVDRLATKKDADASPADYPEESAISKDGRTAAVAWFNLKLFRYELKTVDLSSSAPVRPRTLYTNEDVAWIAPFDWSADGAWLAVQLQRRDKTAQIGVLSVADGSLRILKSVEWRGATTVLFSPDGKYLAYDLPASEKADQRDIFLLAVDGSRETSLLMHPADEAVLAWTPSGRHLLFGSDRLGSTGLWVVAIHEGKGAGGPFVVQPNLPLQDALGLSRSGTVYFGQPIGGQDVHIAEVDFENGRIVSGPEKIAQRFIGATRDAAFSRDGKYVAYQSVRGRSSLVLVIQSLETAETRDLRPELTYFNQPAWRPDGRVIAVRGRDVKGRDGLYLIDVQTGASSLLVSKEEASGTRRPIWSPDGNAVYYLRDSKAIARDVSSGVERELFSVPDMAQPRLSPDGRQFAIIGGKGRSTVMVMPADGGSPGELAKAGDGGFFRSLEWACDGRAVMASRSGGSADTDVELWRVDLNGGSTTKVLLPAGADFSLHPDGRRIAFTSGQRQKEVWAIDNLLPRLDAKH